ncbi:HD-GYP domain-containing protein [Thiomicrorhabdus immobilis]|uniref:HD-GYP domain-containing protein n=1 Tax=Thiomicrorhabdus immobilis TaxID=2791037 RepID=UPI001F44818A|nr:HD domain-containing phosphohydrolase [Thiomicrorhabdus immobilis]
MKYYFRSITEELFQLHDKLRKQWPGLSRIAVAIYDNETDILHTFIKSSPDEELLNHYSVQLKDVPSLVELANSGECRIMQDLMVLQQNDSVHSKVISQHFKSSYTEPFYVAGDLLGFVFYDADECGYFTDELIDHLQTYSRLIESLIVSEILPIKTLVALMNVTQEITNLRDSETGKHLIRMAHYMELIAIELAEEYGFTDEQIEYIWCYAPLHDIGKIAISDSILLKPGRHTAEETKIMRTHVVEGLKMVDRMLQNFSFQQFHHIDILKDIIGSHHEWYDGSGYPNGLKGDEIPIVGRIAAVADVFDALISNRVYRAGWSFDEVVDYLKAGKGKQFDPKCVDALIRNEDKIKEINNNFQDIYNV